MIVYDKNLITTLNKDLEKHFTHLFPITNEMRLSFSGVSRLVMLDRYTQKDISLKTLKVGDLVLTIIKDDPKFPARGIGYIKEIKHDYLYIQIDDEFIGQIGDEHQNGLIKRQKREVEKPLELYYEQIAKRVAFHLGENEKDSIIDDFVEELTNLHLVPAGRILYGAGSQAKVTYFNCYVMPFIDDSREGLALHRKEVMEIMARGGGVGTNGATLRPKNAIAKGVNGKSSGSVSWLNDLAQLTHLVEQGGSRRGAQMIMLPDWHPDIIEFIIAKMQNPKILKFIIDTTNDELIKKVALEKLKFTPLTDDELSMYKNITNIHELNGNMFSKATVEKAYSLLKDGGFYEVNEPDFMSGANISVALTKEFMEAVEKDLIYELKFPDLDSYNKKEKAYYDEHWRNIGDVREWEKHGFKSLVYHQIPAKELWHLINICATYSAEPGIFFLDNANHFTNAKAYGQKVVCTNPCGEQPLAAYSVCNLAALNLAKMVDIKEKEIKWETLERTIKTSVRMLDNVIDKTYYFLDENKKQALGERRIGLGVMGLHDLLIHSGLRYGSKEANLLLDRLFKFIATKSYEASIEIAQEKGSFPFLEEFGSKEAFVEGAYIQKLPLQIQKDILKYGIRNSHLLTIAPTGSTGTMIGVSTGLEPYFAFTYFRSGRLGKFIEVNAHIVEEYLSIHPEHSKDNLPDIFISAMELTPEEHVDTQCIIQNWVDSSISKTVNAPRGYTVEDVENLYMRLYKGGAKGGTVYVDGSRDAQVLTLKKEDKKEIPVQVDIIDLGIELSDKQTPTRQDFSKTPLRSDRQDREIGNEVGNLCPICREGIVQDIGGCHTCTNCNAQLKCDL
ncbi:MAG: vitamin B12-dependent ribonucleotide reductase [Acholeplasmatales bacterium]|jgi:ribonucleoside-diphosphate reductase alpha chain|nr:vitamin B12-dependent ribonucleotide reductase [Acholeplasmatales bacterium]